MDLSGNLGVIEQTNDPQVQEVIEGVHASSEVHPVSVGVGLDTENKENIGLYERFGYSVVVKSDLDGSDFSSMFRSNN